MARDKESALLLTVANALSARAGSSMRQDAHACSLASSAIFAPTQSILSMLCGHDSAASRNGIATTGGNVFQITQTVAEPPVNGPQTICLVAAGGSGSFRYKEATSAQALFMTAASSSCRKVQRWPNDFTRTFSATLLVAKFSAQPK